MATIARSGPIQAGPGRRIGADRVGLTPLYLDELNISGKALNHRALRGRQIRVKSPLGSGPTRRERRERPQTA